MAKFFIVDDEPFLHELYRDILTMAGHEVMGEAFNGSECLDKLMNDDIDSDPDIIIMDHRMPVKNGLEVTKELLDRKPRLKVLFISADVSIKKEAMAAGAMGFIKKPFTIKYFINQLEKIED